MIIALRCVGIDVSKHYLDIFDDGLGVPERIANAPQAITQIAARWRCDVLVVFEATGVYDLELREALSEAGIRFARINPARARDLVGDDIWPLVDPSRPPSFDSKAPGADLRTLTRIVDRLEQL